jgi:multiple sugar transport system substrate-binding protein
MRTVTTAPLHRLMVTAAAAGFVAMLGSQAPAETLTFVWHAGTCADTFYNIAKDYPDKNVQIVPDLVPYGPLWHDKIAAEFAIKGAGMG